MRAQIRGFLIDMDGVLYRGDLPLPGARRFVQALQDEDVPFILLTNNSTRTPSQYMTKLEQMGLHVAPSALLTSAQATAMYLEKVAPPGTRMYVIGEDGLRNEITERGYVITEDDVAFVVAGQDTRLTYEKLRIATLAIRSGAIFIGSNPDRSFPAEDGITPGTGAILAALEAASDVTPTVIGKPQQVMFDLALEQLGTRPEETAMIGDRLETDILGANEAGLLTLLVLTGITSRQDLLESDIRPDVVYEDLLQLYNAMFSEPSKVKMLQT